MRTETVYERTQKKLQAMALIILPAFLGLFTFFLLSSGQFAIATAIITAVLLIAIIVHSIYTGYKFLVERNYFNKSLS